MSESIIQEQRECYVCGSQKWLEKHHVFGGCNRKHSEEDGLYVYLCHEHHNEPPGGVHFDKDFMLSLRQIGQSAYELQHSRKDFMVRYGMNYL